ncbi:MAG TPA: tripartite tricarboxylate transporter TctB family protein [Burkholderiales bacterium]|nr:tripartite tricarboxylate transporter TctB family protein [Burkholderiales bacterium]
MSENHREEGADRPAVKTRTMEIVVALLLFVIGAMVSIDSYRLGARWGEDGPQSGYFPFYIGLIICISSAVTLVQALAGKLGPNVSFVDRGPLRQVFAVLIPAALYILGIQLIGIYVASMAYIAVFMRWLGHYSWPKSIFIGLAVSIFVFVMFEVWFKVPLYRGTVFDPLSLIGY